MENRSVFLGAASLGAIAAFAASFAPRAAVAPRAPAAYVVVPPDTGVDPAARTRPRNSSAPTPYRKGQDLLEAFLGADLAEGASRYGLDVLIATLPDPVESRLDWGFDSQLEAMRRAYERAGYVTDRFWLPPRSGTRARFREAYPGVFLFRSGDRARAELRLLYVVGEVPTGGIHKEALRAALRERAELLGAGFREGRARADTLLLLGPSFSGSAPSLRLALERWLARDGRSLKSVRLLSGAATSPANRDTLTFDRVRFAATVNSDASLERGLRAALACLGIKPSQVALLREATTQYGASLTPVARAEQSAPTAPAADPAASCLASPPPADTTGAFLDVPFPMSIATLRSEYARNPEPSAGGAAPVAGSLPHVALSLDDSERPRETPPVMSPLTAASAELLLDQISQTLQDHRIRVVGILATDVRDKLFLGSEIRKRVRDVQLFTYESNVLYLRSDFNMWLQGMLVFSTYPLFLQNQLWMPGPNGSQQLAFSSDAAEGVYNAALVLLGADSAVAEYELPAIAGQPMLPYRQPPVWLTAVGRSSFVPIATLSAPPPGDGYLETLRSEPRPPPTWALPAGFLAFAMMLVLGLGIFILAVWSIGAERGAGQLAPATPDALAGAARDWDTIGLRVRAASLHIHYEVYLSLLFVALGSLFAPVAVITYKGLGDVWSLLWVRTFIAVFTAAWVIALGRSAFTATRLALRHRTEGWHYVSGSWGSWTDRIKWRIEVLARALVVIVGAAYAVLTARLVFRIWHLQAANSLDFRLFFQRAIQIDGGVSPLVPLVLSGIGFAAWCGWHLRRIGLLSQPTAFEAACRQRRAADRVAQAVAEIRSRLFLVVPETQALYFLAFLVLLVLWLLPQFGRSLEHLALGSGVRGLSSFDWLLRYGIMATLIATPWAVYRMVAVWRALRESLALIEGTPLVNAFERLPPRIGSLTRLSLFSARQTTVVSATTARQWEQLRRIYHEKAADFAAPVTSERAMVERIKAVATSPEPGFGGLADPTTEAAGAAFAPLYRIVEDAWNQEPSAKSIEYALEAAKGGTENTSVLFYQSCRDAVRLWVRLAEELVAVQVVEYLDWVVRQLRNLAVFLLLSLLLTTALLSSYPFQPRSLVKLVFVIVFAGTIAALLMVITQINRNEVLSRIAKTTPGQVTWDTSFVFNLALFGAVPLLTLVSSEFPTVGNVFFSWVSPLLRAFSKG